MPANEAQGRATGHAQAQTPLEERLARIRMPVKEMARRVRCDHATITNHMRGRSRMSERVLREVDAALVEEERELLAHLVRVHPDHASALLARAAA